ncbi:MAG: SUMF1/EgtB/PvdO family nonheme iron enzyme, partial [Nannocystaceae bacterium]|nr:SUMF1/EgtB/PvdO family nonheme iron enzyme [Nannocystaceae bacterium]
MTSLVCGACSGPADALIGPLDDPWVGKQERCAVVGSRANPLIVEWPAAARGSLEMRLRRGVVVVRYQGCSMEVLRGCSVPDSSYRYGGFTHKAETVRMTNADELYANLPMGAARLEAKLQRAKALEVSMTMVGMYEADRDTVSASELRGECDDATHVIVGVQVGAYAFFADGTASVGAAAGLARGPGLGAQTTARRELLEHDGDPHYCEGASAGDSEPPDGCGALLRLEVMPLGAPAPVVSVASDCPPGLNCGGANITSSDARCEAGMSWIPGAEPGQGFCLDDTEVTTWAYEQCAAAAGCPAAASTVDWKGISTQERDGASQLCNALRADRAAHPINCVTWHAADTFCRWRDAALPTEEQFSWAARGGDLDRRFPWGDAAPGPGRVNACGEECRAWFRRNGKAREPIAYRGNDGWPTTAAV